ncbi:hypothetical protein ACFQ51_37835 [Streptomyces kaempferi]
MTGVGAGQRVMALDGVNAPGFYAELVVVPAERVTVLPEGVELTQAATLPVAWLSAWYCLLRLAKVTKDDTVLVKAAASGVGSAAVQIAAAAAPVSSRRRVRRRRPPGPPGSVRATSSTPPCTPTTPRSTRCCG